MHVSDSQLRGSGLEVVKFVVGELIDVDCGANVAAASKVACQRREEAADGAPHAHLEMVVREQLERLDG